MLKEFMKWLNMSYKGERDEYALKNCANRFTRRFLILKWMYQDKYKGCISRYNFNLMMVCTLGKEFGLTKEQALSEYTRVLMSSK